MSHWNQSRLNERGIAPERERGKVIFNAGVDKTLVAMGRPCKTSYYKQANGQYADWRDKVTNGDIVFTIVNAPTGIELGDQHSYLNRAHSDRLLGISVLNGLGVSGDDNDTLMQRVTVLGIAELSSKAPSPSKLYNCASGGVLNVRNNGNQMINVNDTVIAYAPSNAELARGTAGGTTRSTAEEAGLVKLWYVPYNASLHKNQAKQIMACLDDENNEVNYLPAFRRHCRKYMDSMLANAAIIVAHYWEELTDVPGASMEDRLELMLSDLGHSEFREREKNFGPDKMEEVTTLRVGLRDKLFRPYSDYKRQRGQADPRLFAQDEPNKLQTRLNELQSKAAFQFLDSTRFFTRHLEQHILGEAKSAAEPGKDFTIQMKDYAR